MSAILYESAEKFYDRSDNYVGIHYAGVSIVEPAILNYIYTATHSKITMIRVELGDKVLHFNVHSHLLAQKVVSSIMEGDYIELGCYARVAYRNSKGNHKAIMFLDLTTKCNNMASITRSL